MYMSGSEREKEERPKREKNKRKIRNEKLKVDTISFIPPGRNKKMFS